MSNFAIVMTTIDSRDGATAICDALLRDKLAACIQQMPITSSYVWDNNVAQDDEILMLIKIKTGDYPDVETAIKAVHSYDTPEIILTPITAGNPAYLDWITTVTRPSR